ncbi:unnamed protein product [Gordionus sp. m RMFG-2023]
MLCKNLFSCIKKDKDVSQDENGRVRLKKEKERKGLCGRLREWFNREKRAWKKGGRKDIVRDNVPEDAKEEVNAKVWHREGVRYDEASLNNFNLINVIGKGAFGKVFLAESVATKELYALKAIQKSTLKLKKAFDRIRIEKEIFEASRNHPFLVRFHTSIETPSKFIFALEYINGGDLRHHLEKTGRLAEDAVRFYLSEIIVGLTFLHSKGIVHRDIKPDNVLIDKDGHIRITDFGLSKNGLNGNNKTRSLCGTPGYLAPEMFGGQGYGFSVDFYALGIMMYEMLSGNPAFVYAREQRRTLCQSLFGKENAARISNISKEASAVLTGFLIKNPRKRLGCHPQKGFQQIISMPFFKGLDWELVEAKKIEPPYKPLLSGPIDISNFKPKFTVQEAILTPEYQKDLNLYHNLTPILRNHSKIMVKNKQSAKYSASPKQSSYSLQFGDWVT